MLCLGVLETGTCVSLPLSDVESMGRSRLLERAARGVWQEMCRCVVRWTSCMCAAEGKKVVVASVPHVGPHHQLYMPHPCLDQHGWQVLSKPLQWRRTGLAGLEGRSCYDVSTRHQHLLRMRRSWLLRPEGPLLGYQDFISYLCSLYSHFTDSLMHRTVLCTLMYVYVNCSRCSVSRSAWNSAV